MMRSDAERKQIDRSDMLAVIYSLPDQMEKSLDVDVESEEESRNVIVAGVGGSAIAGDMLRVWLEQFGRGLHVVRSPVLPRWVRRDDLLVCISYSGNTAETLNCLREGIQKECRILCITSGGKMREVCQSEKLPVLEVPGGLPPRGALGHLFSALGGGVAKEDSFSVELKGVVSSLRQLREKLLPQSEENIAERIAREIVTLYPLIYADDRFLPIAMRWKTQLNENSKKHAWFGAFPEINHNEVVGWDKEDGTDRFCAVFLRDDGTQMGRTIEEIEKRAKVIEVRAEGDTLLSRMFYALLIGDFVSYYCAMIRGIDPTPVDAIQSIKDSKRDA
ncbi:MAG: bifunctional phosphoglucose/phosphomannose isomerase [Thermoplasmata archaeon]